MAKTAKTKIAVTRTRPKARTTTRATGRSATRPTRSGRSKLSAKLSANPPAKGAGRPAAPAKPGALRDGSDGGRSERPTAKPTAGAPPEPEAPPQRDAPIATRDIARLLRYSERFGGDKIDVRMLPLQLHVRSGALAVCDPGQPATWRVLDRPIGAGAFRVMLSIARPDDDAGAPRERLAAVVIHVGRPPIATWTVARFAGQARSIPADALPRTPVTSGWLALLDAGDGSPGVIALPPATGVAPIEVPLTDGRRALALPCGNGAFTAYWAIDADDKPICVVVDFDAFAQKAWKAKPSPRT